MTAATASEPAPTSACWSWPTAPRRAAEDIAPFYTRIRRGRPPSPEQLAELEARYAAIGGLSPLTERTQAQVDGAAGRAGAARARPLRRGLRGQARRAR